MALSEVLGNRQEEPAPAPEETSQNVFAGFANRTKTAADLESVNLELARRQLANIDQLQPFQKELLELTLADLKRQGADLSALDAAISPADRAAFAKSEFERAQRLGPIQDELVQLQLDELRRGGAATPEQLARIKEATDRGIEAGSADIDMSTQRGIGLIADELANSRGLRLTDSPIMREAALLSRSGMDQKASLIKNLRAGQAQAALNYPLGVQQIQSGINLNQQQIFQAAQDFQTDLRARAQANRMAMTGSAGQFGIGLSSVGPRPTYPSQRQGTDNIGNFARVAAGIGSLAAFAGSDRRIKKDYGVVAKTDSGIDLHVYRYKWEDDNDPLRLGVMAQDVEKVKPEAVRTGYRGTKFVDYSRL